MELRQQVIAAAVLSLREQDVAFSTHTEGEPLYPPQVMLELDELSDPRRHGGEPPNVGPGLDGSEAAAVHLSLIEVLVTAAQHNLDVELASVVPQIRHTQVIEAEAEYDWTVFGETNVGHTDRPIPAESLSGVAVGSDATIRDTARIETGLRKRIQETGAAVSFSTGSSYLNDQSPQLEFLPDPSWTADMALAMSQPLLRDFGAQVNGARIRLAENAQQRDVLGVKNELLRILADTEEAYWVLAFERLRLSIQQQLLEITVRTRDEVSHRREVDANPVQLAQAESEVKLRQIEVIRAQAAVRLASDRLKRLLNAPGLPLAGETVVHPTDYPDELPGQFMLRNAIVTAIRNRPYLAQVMLELNDAQIRRTVADNQRLPRLDLSGEVRHYGLGDEVGGGYGAFGDDFIEYLVGLKFEQPIGNREGEAVYLRTRLTEYAQNVRYRNAAQDVVLSVKDAMRNMQMAYSVLEVARGARRASAENLRALQEREKTGQELTPEFLLDLKLRTQQRLAQAEIDEIRAAVDYNIAQARFHQATGMLLDERKILLEAATSNVVSIELPGARAKPSGAGSRSVPPFIPPPPTTYEPEYIPGAER